MRRWDRLVERFMEEYMARGVTAETVAAVTREGSASASDKKNGVDSFVEFVYRAMALHTGRLPCSTHAK